jgi:hypothetical protein
MPRILNIFSRNYAAILKESRNFMDKGCTFIVKSVLRFVHRVVAGNEHVPPETLALSAVLCFVARRYSWLR